MPDCNDPGFDINKIVHGGDVYRNRVLLDYSVNLNPLAMPGSVMEASLSGLGEMHQYPDPYQVELRKAIGCYEGIDSGNIVCGNGASELIMAAVHAFRPRAALTTAPIMAAVHAFRPRTAIITAPCYAGYARALMASDAKVTEYVLDENRGFLLDHSFLECLDENIDMVFLADPNNPNGAVIDQVLKEKIIEKCADKGIVLLLDECFLPLTGMDEAKSTERGCVLHLRAFTKTFAIPGIRIGYLYSDNTDALELIRLHLPEWNVSRIAERTGTEAAKVLSDTEYLRDSVLMIRREREYLSHELKQLGIRVYPSDVNYLLLKSDMDLYHRLLERGVLVRRCANFSGLNDSFIRIAVRSHEDNLHFIEILKTVLK